jgi:adenosylhomocysteine nucleosidase
MPRMDPKSTLICFAVKEEMKFFKDGACRTVLTGMGQKNAAESLQKELASQPASLVLTCGFAGALNPDLSVGDVLFDEDENTGLKMKLMELGAKPGGFYCADKVASTAREKEVLRNTSNADAVEMESSAIRAICREKKIPSATIRVISDAADEDLPLDFNEMMTPDYRLSMAKLLGRLLREPKKIPQLMEFQGKTVFAARRLDELLGKLLEQR